MKIIAFNGPPSSGKDTAAGILKYNLLKHGVSCKQFSFAQSLKYAAHAVLDISEDRVDSYGKDIKYPEFNNKSLRDVYIWLGEISKENFGADYWAKKLIKKVDFYHKTKLEMGCNEDDIVAVITDLGFDFELEALKKADFDISIVRLEREGCDFRIDPRCYVEPQGCDFEILSNNSNLNDFKNTLMNYAIERGIWTRKSLRL